MFFAASMDAKLQRAKWARQTHSLWRTLETSLIVSFTASIILSWYTSLFSAAPTQLPSSLKSWHYTKWAFVRWIATRSPTGVSGRLELGLVNRLPSVRVWSLSKTSPLRLSKCITEELVQSNSWQITLDIVCGYWFVLSGPRPPTLAAAHNLDMRGGEAPVLSITHQNNYARDGLRTQLRLVYRSCPTRFQILDDCHNFDPMATTTKSTFALEWFLFLLRLLRTTLLPVRR